MDAPVETHMHIGFIRIYIIPNHTPYKLPVQLYTNACPAAAPIARVIVNNSRISSWPWVGAVPRSEVRVHVLLNNVWLHLHHGDRHLWPLGYCHCSGLQLFACAEAL